MPIWSEILAELSKTRDDGPDPDFDRVQRKYLAELYWYTGTAVIIQASISLFKNSEWKALSFKLCTMPSLGTGRGLAP